MENRRPLPKLLQAEHVEYRIGLKSAGRLGYDREPRATVGRTIMEVFFAQQSQVLIGFAQEHDTAFSDEPSLVDSLRERLSARKVDEKELVFIRQFKPEVVRELIRARLKDHTYREQTAKDCEDIMKELYRTGFEDHTVSTGEFL